MGNRGNHDKFVQTPEEYLNWAIDWASRGLGTDTIATSEWVGSSDDFTLSNPSIDNTLGRTTIFLTGGVADTQYMITNNITTSSGLKMTETAPYYCEPVRLIGT
jgi:hypothetical protein